MDFVDTIRSLKTFDSKINYLIEKKNYIIENDYDDVYDDIVFAFGKVNNNEADLLAKTIIDIFGSVLFCHDYSLNEKKPITLIDELIECKNTKSHWTKLSQNDFDIIIQAFINNGAKRAKEYDDRVLVNLVISKYGLNY